LRYADFFKQPKLSIRPGLTGFSSKPTCDGGLIGPGAGKPLQNRPWPIEDPVDNQVALIERGCHMGARKRLDLVLTQSRV